MTPLRRAGTVTLGIVFAAVTLAYAFFQPFIPGAIRHAIPAEATFVFEAKNLDELLESPVSDQLNKAFGSSRTLESLLKSGTWTGLAAASEIAVADLPFRHAGEGKSWAVVSWVGWRSPWLRWKLEGIRHENVKRLGKHAVWPVWQYDGPQIPTGTTLTFSLTDNLFIACLSERPSDISILLNTYDHHTKAPSL